MGHFRLFQASQAKALAGENNFFPQKLRIPAITNHQEKFRRAASQLGHLESFFTSQHNADSPFHLTEF